MHTTYIRGCVLQVSFDFLCTLALYLLRLSGVPSALAARLAPMVAALPAAVLAAVLSHPGDVLLTEFYKARPGCTHLPSVRYTC